MSYFIISSNCLLKIQIFEITIIRIVSNKNAEVFIFGHREKNYDLLITGNLIPVDFFYR